MKIIIALFFFLQNALLKTYQSTRKTTHKTN